jgi:hypothetical protein
MIYKHGRANANLEQHEADVLNDFGGLQFKKINAAFKKQYHEQIGVKYSAILHQNLTKGYLPINPKTPEFSWFINTINKYYSHQDPNLTLPTPNQSSYEDPQDHQRATLNIAQNVQQDNHSGPQVNAIQKACDMEQDRIDQQQYKFSPQPGEDNSGPREDYQTPNIQHQMDQNQPQNIHFGHIDPYHLPPPTVQTPPQQQQFSTPLIHYTGQNLLQDFHQQQISGQNELNQPSRSSVQVNRIQSNLLIPGVKGEIATSGQLSDPQQYRVTNDPRQMDQFQELQYLHVPGGQGRYHSQYVQHNDQHQQRLNVGGNLQPDNAQAIKYELQDNHSQLQYGQNHDVQQQSNIHYSPPPTLQTPLKQQQSIQQISGQNQLNQLSNESVIKSESERNTGLSTSHPGQYYLAPSIQSQEVKVPIGQGPYKPQHEINQNQSPAPQNLGVVNKQQDPPKKRKLASYPRNFAADSNQTCSNIGGNFQPGEERNDVQNSDEVAQETLLAIADMRSKAGSTPLTMEHFRQLLKQYQTPSVEQPQRLEAMDTDNDFYKILQNLTILKHELSPTIDEVKKAFITRKEDVTKNEDSLIDTISNKIDGCFKFSLFDAKQEKKNSIKTVISSRIKLQKKIRPLAAAFLLDKETQLTDSERKRSEFALLWMCVVGEDVVPPHNLSAMSWGRNSRYSNLAAWVYNTFKQRSLEGTKQQ